MGEMAKYAIKVGLAVLAGTAMLTALLSIISVVNNGLSSRGLLLEAVRLIGVILPFEASTILNTVSTSVAALLSFITARKVYEVASNFAQSTD